MNVKIGLNVLGILLQVTNLCLLYGNLSEKENSSSYFEDFSPAKSVDSLPAQAVSKTSLQEVKRSDPRSDRIVNTVKSISQKELLTREDVIDSFFEYEKQFLNGISSKNKGMHSFTLEVYYMALRATNRLPEDLKKSDKLDSFKTLISLKNSYLSLYSSKVKVQPVKSNNFITPNSPAPIKKGVHFDPNIKVTKYDMNAPPNKSLGETKTYSLDTGREIKVGGASVKAADINKIGNVSKIKSSFSR